MDLEKKYYAKLMLAGEYGVIVGSEALTVPLRNFYAKLANRDESTDEEKVIKSVSHLRELFSYIHSLPRNSFYAEPDLKNMDFVLKKGYFIDSSIPHAYGIGSSGAVSALIYDNFFSQNRAISFQKQRKDLAAIESFFHGKSSGVDAMSCYANRPLHFLPDGSIHTLTSDPLKPQGGYRFFLLDSGQVYDTGPLVKIFLDNFRQNEYKKIITEDYFPLIHKLIVTLMDEQSNDPALIFRAISDLQWNYFRDMIPEIMYEHWIEGQVSSVYYLKLNGSGGGYMLGIAHEDSIEAVEGMLGKSRLIWL